MNKKLDIIVFDQIYLNSLEGNLEKLNQFSNTKNEQYASLTKQKIIKYCNLLGFEKEIIVVIDNLGTTPKIALSADENTKKLANYSDGQKHKIALAVFFTMLEVSDIHYNYLVFDDPVISLDVHAYHAFKNLIINQIPSIPHFKKDLSVIILTHNISFLYILLSNVSVTSGNTDLYTIYEMNEDKLSVVPLDSLKLDDISLFKKSINEIHDINELSLSYWLINRVFRSFLDLKLRMEGTSEFGNPGTEIKKLNLSQQDKNRLQNISNCFSENCRKEVHSISKIKKLYILLNESLELMSFPKIVDDEAFGELEKFEDDELTLKDPEANNFIQEVLLFARNLNFSNKIGIESNIKNYIDHPRHQITESLVGIKSKIDFT